MLFVIIVNNLELLPPMQGYEMPLGFGTGRAAAVLARDSPVCLVLAVRNQDFCDFCRLFKVFQGLLVVSAETGSQGMRSYKMSVLQNGI